MAGIASFKFAPSTGSRRRPEPARREHDHFCAESGSWLSDYALFMALKEANGGGAWSGCRDPLQKRDPDVLAEAGQRHSDAVERFKFYRNY